MHYLASFYSSNVVIEVALVSSQKKRLSFSFKVLVGLYTVHENHWTDQMLIIDSNKPENILLDIKSL